MAKSTLDDFTTRPSALLTDGLIPVPLFAVTRISLSESYSLPPIGSSQSRAAVQTSDDTVSLGALLVGPQRFAWKQALELLADLSRRGSALAKLTGSQYGGLILVTSLTTRMDMHVTELTFSASPQRRDTIEVSITLKHVPRPGALNKLLDVGAAAAMTAVEFLT